MKEFYLVFLLFIFVGCDSREDSVIKGSKYSYIIPDNVISNRSVDSGEVIYGADISKNISLVISNGLPELDEGSDDYSITVNVFWDKKYDAYTGLLRTTERVINESKKIDCDIWSSCYQREFAGIKTDYHFTFDPERNAGSGSDNDFILSVFPRSTNTAGDAVSRVRPSCSFTQVIDGLLLQVSSVGDLCNGTNAKKVYRHLPKLFESWRWQVAP